VRPDDLRQALQENAHRLRGLLDEAEPKEAAALARELRMTLHDLAVLAEPEKGSTVDSLAARRAARIAATEGL
jgi:hypothetical protein